MLDLLMKFTRKFNKHVVSQVVVTLAIVGCAGSKASKILDSNSNPVNLTAAPHEGEHIQLMGKEVRKLVLKNGVTLYYVQDSSLPRIAYSAFYQFGAQQDPNGMEGLTSMVASLLEYGTSRRSAPKIADEFAGFGSGFSGNVSYDFSVFEASTVSTKAPQVLDLFLDVLLHPTFPEKEFKKVRDQYLVAAKKRSENASGYADQKINEFIFQGHPYQREINGTESSLRKIQVQNLRTHFNSFFTPAHLSFAIVGKFDSIFASLVQAKLESIPVKKSAEIVWTTTPDNIGTRVRFFNKPGAEQSEIRFGHVGLTRADSDFLLMRIANTILGGGFSSRLNQRVRDDLGLTYSIGSELDVRKGRGPIIVSTFTRHPMLQRTLGESLKVFGEFADKGVTQEELDTARTLMKGQFPRSLETADKIVFNVILADHYGVSVDQISNFYQRIEKVKLDELNRAIRKYYKPSDLRIVILSDKKQIGAQIESFGPVEEIEVR